METINLNPDSKKAARTNAVIASKDLQDITPEEVLQLESFKGLSVEGAGELAASIKTFTQAVFFSCMSRKSA
jgi:hypothetical protein